MVGVRGILSCDYAMVFTTRAQGEDHGRVGAVAPEPAVVAVESGDKLSRLIQRAAFLLVSDDFSAAANGVEIEDRAVGRPPKPSPRAVANHQFDLDTLDRCQPVADPSGHCGNTGSAAEAATAGPGATSAGGAGNRI